MIKDIKDLTLDELKSILVLWGFPTFSAKQIFSWVYQKNAKDFAQMSNLGLGLRKKLKDNFFITDFRLVEAVESKDKTRKLLFHLRDGNFIETVIIPSGKRVTGCISTQAGCKFGCKFCASGLKGFKRDLTTGEIIEQVLSINSILYPGKLTHLVFMGIGEPMDNYDNLLRSIRIIKSCDTFNIGVRRITISTCGIIPGIERLSQENLQIELSVSLHAADDATRSFLMPVNKIYPLARLIPVCEEYAARTGRQVTFEYILLKDINSDLQNARNLCKILNKLKLCKINLIPANQIKENNIVAAQKKDIIAFKECLIKNGINVTLRVKRGSDIEAACGQLRLGHENK